MGEPSKAQEFWSREKENSSPPSRSARNLGKFYHEDEEGGVFRSPVRVRNPGREVLDSSLFHPSESEMTHDLLSRRERLNQKLAHVLKNIDDAELPNNIPARSGSPQKALQWDQRLIATLEAQGFVPTESRSKLMYDFEEEQARRLPSSTLPPPPPPPLPGKPQPKMGPKPVLPPKYTGTATTTSVRAIEKPVGHPKEIAAATLATVPPIEKKSTYVEELVARFGGSRSNSGMKAEAVDPSLLPVSQKAAIFEKNAAVIPKPKNPIALPVPPPVPSDSGASRPTTTASSLAKGENAMTTQRMLMENFEGNWRNNEIAQQIADQKAKDMEVVLNRFKLPVTIVENHPEQRFEAAQNEPKSTIPHRYPMPPPCPPPYMPPPPIEVPPPIAPPPTTELLPPTQIPKDKESQHSLSSESSVKLLSGSMYPSLSSLEDDYPGEGSSSTETLSEDVLPAERHEADAKHMIRSVSYMSAMGDLEESSTDDVSESSTSSSSIGGVKRGHAAVSVGETEAKMPRMGNLKEETKPPGSPLIHSLSMYRREKAMQVSTAPPPKAVIIWETKLEEESDDDVDVEKVLREMRRKINELDVEAERQLVQMKQASNAIVVCKSRAGFRLSPEFVEAERVLLVAEAKHSAVSEHQHFLRRLVKERHIERGSRGSVMFRHVVLHLKPEFIQYKNSPDYDASVHYFVVKFQHGDQVYFTNMMSTKQDVALYGAFVFPNVLEFHDLPPQFKIEIEVFALQMEEEAVDHTEKYNLPKKEEVKKHWWSQTKKQSQQPQSPILPDLPSKIRKTSFGAVGQVTLGIKNMADRKLMLRGVPTCSPLLGVMEVDTKWRTESKERYRGFLHKFEELSNGQGAWTRRWFVLGGSGLSYWRYPSDVGSKDPQGVIDLKECVTERFSNVRRDRCARSHTFLLATERPSFPSDANSILVERKGSTSICSYLLSCDSKEEMSVWCRKLTEALYDVRSWDPEARRPRPEGNPDYMPS